MQTLKSAYTPTQSRLWALASWLAAKVLHIAAVGHRLLRHRLLFMYSTRFQWKVMDDADQDSGRACKCEARECAGVGENTLFKESDGPQADGPASLK